MWFAVGGTFALIGAAIQAVSSVWSRVMAMNFFVAHAALLKEDAIAVKAEIPWWKPRARRARRKSGLRLAFSTLTPEEQVQARDYDRDVLGWGFVFVGTGMATIAGWVVASAG